MPWHVLHSSKLSFSAYGSVARIIVRIISAPAYLLAKTSMIKNFILQTNGLMERSDAIKLEYLALIYSS